MPLNLKYHLFESPVFHKAIGEVVEFLATTPVQPLPPLQSFMGGGVYVLYYTGPFEAYKALADANRVENTKPIYAGKAVPTGWRQGRKVTTEAPNLYRRLKDHASSISAVQNLSLNDFACRFVILKGNEADMIVTVENALIREYVPLWNCEIDGFGNHDPGVHRYGQLLSDWDTLHTGRSWEKKWQGERPDEGKIKDTVRAYLG